MKNFGGLAGLVTLAVLGACQAGDSEETAEYADAQRGEIFLATFNEDGSLNQPRNWREWVYIGTPLTPHELNGGNANFPEFHAVYMDPASFRHYQRTGEFRDGTQIVKELTLVRGHEGKKTKVLIPITARP